MHLSSKMEFKRLRLTVLCCWIVGFVYGFSGGYNLDDNIIFNNSSVSQDTIPVQERYNDFITDDGYNPFDIQSNEIKQEVEYDPETGNYIIYEKIGDEFFRSPTYMTFEEYVDWKSKKQEREYFGELGGISTGQKSDSGKVDPISKIDIEDQLVDKLFGGKGVTIEPQGNIELTLGADYTRREDPSLTLRQQRQGPFPDFKMNIQMNVDGSIGDKLKLGFNYDTQASFDFDRRIKLEYDSELFSEDDIIKKIEAGDVSMPLRSNLIQGAQKLFGLKTELQFGHLRLTALASQQRSEQESLTIEGGSLIQEFEVRPTEYDENRHFFLSHYHRDNFEKAMLGLPVLESQMNIVNVEVWIENVRNDNATTSSQIVALADLAEFDLDKYHNDMSPDLPVSIGSLIASNRVDDQDEALPDNGVNTLYEKLQVDEDTRLKNNTSANLQSQYGMTQTRDFEIFRGRKLSASEFSYHPQLGFISLNIRLRPDQVLAVSYEYNYVFCNDELFKVGEPADVGSRSSIIENENNGNVDVEVESDKVIYTKLIKSSIQRVNLPSWDFMMKNVYPLGASQINSEDFKFDIFYEDNSDGSIDRFLPDDNSTPLLTLFGLDKLNAYLDPQPDGIFDFVEGLTINTRTGSVYFPVLEPFGEQLAPEYRYQELYDTTITIAQTTLEKNLFVMKGEYKSSISSEISLGSWNLPPGSVRVTAGSVTLQEGLDYEVDYGIGRLRILNPSYLQAGTPIRVSFEDNSLFSLQQKTMLGLRAEYAFSDEVNLGATYLRLSERPFTQKVNFGDDPIFNRVFGLDFTYGKESEWVTKAVDKLPFYSTKEKSKINFVAEVAALKPGHQKAINLDGENQPEGGVVSLDDFEGAGSPIPIGTQQNQWTLASTPNYGAIGRPSDAMWDSDGIWAEGAINNDLSSGYNRALLNWYVVDRSFRSAADQDDPYARRIDQTEFFDRQNNGINLTDLFTFDLSFYPNERGPYNFDTVEGVPGISAGVDVATTLNQQSTTQENDVYLNDPASRWGGITRYLQNADFQAANVEYIDFWLLNPYLDRREGTSPTDGTGHIDGEEGKLVFHLGNVSEDILKDDLQFFENAIPGPEDMIPVQNTVWGTIPDKIPINNGFDVSKRDLQDLGLDGLNNNLEREKFSAYVQNLGSQGINVVDVSNDDFAFDGVQVDQDDNIILKTKDFNNPENNFPDNNNTGNNIAIRGNPNPDKEDLNGNSSLNTSESFYEYVIRLEEDPDNPGSLKRFPDDFIRDEKTFGDEKWYRFQVPINRGESVNGIEGFRSIQFMRMLMTGFQTQKTLRFVELEMVRNTWRRQDAQCVLDPQNPDEVPFKFSIDDVGLQENAGKVPFNYTLPPGIKQEQFFNSFSTVLQDEKALVLNVNDMYAPEADTLYEECAAAVFKTIQVDLRVFENLQLYVHAEQDTLLPLGSLDPEDLSVYIKIGKDFKNNYYEYELPLYFSDDLGQAAVPEHVWLDSNFIDIALEKFTDIKKARAAAGVPNSERFTIDDPTTSKNDRISIKGLPSLGYVKGIEIGIRNRNDQGVPFNGEVWINELRATGLQERGGFAGTARLEVQMADLGRLTSSASYNSLGWGALDQKVDERAKETVLQYDVAADIQLGKFFPDNWGLQVPFYAQYAKEKVTPEFDAYELDLTLDEVDALGIPGVDSRERSVEEETIKTFNFTNVRKERSSGGGKGKTSTPKPWDVSNVSASYAQTQTERKDFLIKEDISKDQRLKLEYNYSNRAKMLKPFNKLKGKWLKVFKEFNLGLLPNSLYVTNELRRFKNTRTFREPITPIFTFDDQRFTWDRGYGFKWDLTKNLKFNFDAKNRAVIDELRRTGISANPETRDYVDERGNDSGDSGKYTSEDVDKYWKDNLYSGGRNKEYTHNFDVTYNVPLKHIPLTSWITVKARYGADYRWSAALLSASEYGHTVDNNQNRSINSTFSFDKLYKKSKFLKEIENPRKSRSNSRSNSSKNDKTLGKDKKDVAGKLDGKNKRTKDKNDGPSFATRALIRPLLALRSVKFNYKENLGTVVPGIASDLESNLLGLSSGFNSPGWAFVGGWQPDITLGDQNNWLRQGVTKGWFTDSSLQNNQVVQRKEVTYDAKVAIEPFKDFKIDVEFKKRASNDVFENFKTVKGLEGSFEELARREVGSVETTYFGLNTFFNDDLEGMFDDFLENRKTISNLLGSGEHDLDGNAYSQGLGAVQTDVILSAFVATYTGRAIDDSWVTRDQGSEASSGLVYELTKPSFIPRPNWTLRYNGLKNIGFFKDRLAQFSLTHSYKSTLRINQYSTNQDFDYQNLDTINLATGNYYSRFEVPLVQINESFSPLIGIQMKTKNDLNLSVEYKTSRTLDLNTDILGNIQEKKSSDITLGLGYTFKDVNIAFLTGDKKSKRKRKKKDGEEEEDEDAKKDERKRNTNRNAAGRGGTDSRPRELTFNVDFSLVDDVTYVHEYEQGVSTINRGQTGIRLSPSLEYNVNENLSLRMFLDYESTKPKNEGVNNQFPYTRYYGGLTARFNLQ